jgi:hypothetical protein
MMQANATAPHAIFGGYIGYSVGVVVYLRPAGVRQIRTPGSGCSNCHPSACLHLWQCLQSGS